MAEERLPQKILNRQLGRPKRKGRARARRQREKEKDINKLENGGKD